MWPREQGGASIGMMSGSASFAASKAGLNGFIAFMKRSDAKRAFDKVDGVEWGGSILHLSWGKAMPLPPRPAFGQRPFITQSCTGEFLTSLYPQSPLLPICDLPGQGRRHRTLSSEGHAHDHLEEVATVTGHRSAHDGQNLAPRQTVRAQDHVRESMVLAIEGAITAVPGHDQGAAALMIDATGVEAEAGHGLDRHESDAGRDWTVESSKAGSKMWQTKSSSMGNGMKKPSETESAIILSTIS